MYSAFTVNVYSWFKNTVAQMVVTMETLSLFRELKGISKRAVFLKDGLAKYDVSAGFSSVYPTIKQQNKKIN